MDNSNLSVTSAWHRLRRQALLAPGPASRLRMTAATADHGSAGAAADADGSRALPVNADDIRMGAAVLADPPDTLPMLYRSEAFAEDLLDSHPQAIW